MALESRFTSWVLFERPAFGFNNIASDEAMMDMFPACVQSRSPCRIAGRSRLRPGFHVEPLTEIGISNAVTLGRDGLESSSSGLPEIAETANANDDGYAADPRVIAVAAIPKRRARLFLQQPGANIWVGAPVETCILPEG